ncbi:MAG: phosphonate ABC transporter ATP-binding protein [Actinomycetota bacterium]|nr:phosphonate ABC transporter ATP-binding protein [Actinomycetota bacterium]
MSTHATRARDQDPARASADRGEPVLEIRGLSKRFDGASHFVLDDVTLSVWPGELVVVLGANGCGKSTMLRCAVRLLDPTSGSVTVAGADLAALSGNELREHRRKVATIFQHGHLVARRSALANVACGGLGRARGVRVAAGRLPAGEMEHGMECLTRVRMTHVAARRADSLSGGEAQRVAIARALSQRPKVLMADEPVASLDPEAAESVMGLLRDLATRDGLGVLCVLHQPQLALRFADRIAGLQAGRIAFDLPAGLVGADVVRALYQDERG